MPTRPHQTRAPTYIPTAHLCAEDDSAEVVAWRNFLDVELLREVHSRRDSVSSRRLLDPDPGQIQDSPMNLNRTELDANEVSQQMPCGVALQWRETEPTANLRAALFLMVILKRTGFPFRMRLTGAANAMYGPLKDSHSGSCMAGNEAVIFSCKQHTPSGQKADVEAPTSTAASRLILVILSLTKVVQKGRETFNSMSWC